MAYFPMYINLEKKPCLVIGGGNVALRKIFVLSDFGADVTVVAPEVSEEIKAFPMVHVLERGFQAGDVKGCALVVAAADEPALNHEIAELCKKRGIPVNAVDQIEDCTFIFPAYVRQNDVVAAFSSSGKSPVIAQYLKAQEKEILTEQIGEINDCLGRWRNTVKELFGTEAERKRVYRKILETGLAKQSVPKDEEIRMILASAQEEADGSRPRQRLRRRKEESNGSQQKIENK